MPSRYSTGWRCPFGPRNAGVAGGPRAHTVSQVGHPAGLLLMEAAESLHKDHGCGVTTFVVLVGRLASTVHSLHSQVGIVLEAASDGGPR